MPLRIENEVRGVLLVHAHRPAAFTDEDELLLTEIATLAGRALGMVYAIRILPAGVAGGS